jgi:ABC-type antimicrobial peptide transport system ATPase subunit
MGKRVRSSDSVPCKKVLLLQILAKFEDILEIKAPTGQTNQQKEQAWSAITKEFNQKSQAGIYLSSEQLKTLWENCQKELLLELEETAEEERDVVTVSRKKFTFHNDGT